MKLQKLGPAQVDITRKTGKVDWSGDGVSRNEVEHAYAQNGLSLRKHACISHPEKYICRHGNLPNEKCTYTHTTRILQPFLSKAIEPPTPRAVEASLQLLYLLGALDKAENLTALGYQLALLPMDPKLGRMVLYGAVFSCFRPLLTLAAILSYRDPFLLPLSDQRQRAQYERKRLAGGSFSDQMGLLRAFEEWELAKRRGGAKEERAYCDRTFLSSSTMHMIHSMRGQFFRLMKESGFLPASVKSFDDPHYNRTTVCLPLVKAILTASTYPNVARIGYRGTKRRVCLTTRDNLTGVDIHPGSVNARVARLPAQYLVYYEGVR